MKIINSQEEFCNLMKVSEIYTSFIIKISPFNLSAHFFTYLSFLIANQCETYIQVPIWLFY